VSEDGVCSETLLKSMEEDEGRRMSSVYEMVINEKQNVSKPWMKAGSFHEEVLKKESVLECRR
jgi:hypothetical protein